MNPIDLQPEINSLQTQLDSLREQFENALTENVKLGDTKKLFHEIRILQERIGVKFRFGV
jgi:peptidoglycan hydrolase CwlO-like protein